MKTSTQSRRVGLTLGALAIAALLPLGATNSAQACPFLGYGGYPKLGVCNPPMVGGGGGAHVIRSRLGYHWSHNWRRR